jgi:penicillin-binding protein 1A
MCLILTTMALLGYLYVLQVYAPGLRAEARSIPSRVQAGLAEHGALYTDLSAMSPSLQSAIVAIEDRRFYHHFGVDPLAIIRAVWVNLQQQHVDQGGSTLEEQLVKRAIVGDDRSLRAKLRTMALAWAVDQEFSKRQILEMYLNAAYYGQGAYGAEAAAHVYFGTDALHLTLPQAALLAALPQAPSIYGANPRSPAVLERQRTVLRDMAQIGAISADQERAAEETPLQFALPNP